MTKYVKYTMNAIVNHLFLYQELVGTVNADIVMKLLNGVKQGQVETQQKLDRNRNGNHSFAI